MVGCGRSGTSLLRSILDAHPDLAVSHEGRFIANVARHRARYERPEGFDVAAFCRDVASDRAVGRNLGLNAADVAAAVDGDPVVSVADAVRRIYTSFAARRGKTRYGDKMPGYVLHLPVLAGVFPEARVVHIIRDGRDVALSSMAIEGHHQDPVPLALNWVQRVRTGRSDGRGLGPDRYREVRYEALLEDPEASVVALCSFLGLDYDPAMLRFFEDRSKQPTRVRANPRHARLNEPVSHGTRSWRTQMKPEDLAVFEAVAGPLLTELGYERGVARPSMSARATAALGKMRWQTLRVRSRLPLRARRASWSP